MDNSLTMHRDKEARYLPTEIVLLIAQKLDSKAKREPYEENFRPRQHAFYNFCLVSRQWYSVGVGFLYECPLFLAGNAFEKFADTICSSRDSRKGNVDFGSLVKTFTMAGLVHHSSNSLTARLLSRMKKNLIIFIAPRVSFALNCLPALSKCQNLVVLNLSLVSSHSIPFSQLKRAICNLKKLEYLILPYSMSLTRADYVGVGQWPPGLWKMTIGGTLDPEVMRTFEWPPSIRDLYIQFCTDLRTNVLESVLTNEQLRVRLKRLHLHDTNGRLCSDRVSNVLYTLPNLIHLKIPFDATEQLLILPTPIGLPPLPIRVLELEPPVYADPLPFDLAEELIKAFDHNLANVWALGVSHHCLGLVTDRKGEIEEAIWKHIDEGDDNELEWFEDLGFYQLDDEEYD